MARQIPVHRLGLFGIMLGAVSWMPQVSADNQSEIAALTKRADEWDKAIVRKDRTAIEANMSDDFRQIDADGDIVRKKQFVDELISPDLTIHPYGVDDFEIRLYGDVALLSGRTHMTGVYKGKDFTTDYRYIDTYVRRGGEWRVVSVQITRIKK